MASFFKRIFGGGKAEPAPPPSAAPTQSAAPDLQQAADQARANARRADRARDPIDWAAQQQFLALALYNLARTQEPRTASRTLGEGMALLGEAISVTDRHGQGLFWGSLNNLRAQLALERSRHLEGDEKGRTLADSANWAGAALEELTLETAPDLWSDIHFFRGAALHEMALMRNDDTALAWHDEAIACFDTVNDRMKQTKGSPHPIAAFNAFKVLEVRAQKTAGAAARHYFERARAALTEAVNDETFRKHLDNIDGQFATLDAAIEALR